MAASPLLLDEFYRSGCWIAGAYPLWWLVPPNHTGQKHLEYVETLRHNDLLASQRWLDFGPCTSFTNLDLIVALGRELNAGLKNPYKALLKLALLESYAIGAQALSETYKKHVCKDGEVDPYLLLAKHLDRHFTANRLSTLHRAWLAKVTQKNGHLDSNDGWLALAEQWGFTAPKTDRLRFVDRWSMADFSDENDSLHAAFTYPLSALTTLLKKPGTHLPTQVSRQTDRVRARFLAKPFLVRPQHSYHANAHITQTADSWKLSENDRTLFSSDTYSGVFCWLWRRGFDYKALNPHWRNSPHVKDIFRTLASPGSVWLINTEPELIVDQTHQLATNDDILCYGHEQSSLIHSSIWVEEDRSTVPLPLNLSLLRVLKTQVQLYVTGDLRRGRIRAQVQSLITNARLTLGHPNQVFLYLLGQDLVALFKDSHDEVCEVTMPISQAPIALQQLGFSADVNFIGHPQSKFPKALAAQLALPHPSPT